jgi:hypothetical protein
LSVFENLDLDKKRWFELLTALNWVMAIIAVAFIVLIVVH